MGHWLWTLALVILTASGLAIFNASPNLDASDKTDPERRVLAITAEGTTTRHPTGIVTIFGRRFDTTGLFGYSEADGQGMRRAFPAALTLPATRKHALAYARHWHLFFGWILTFALGIYLLRRLRTSRIAALLPHPASGADYHLTQKIGYAAIVFGVFPFVILSGLALSPGIDAAADLLLDAMGGRQFARLWHFAAMIVLLAFTAGHITFVAVSGLRTKVGAMITGRYPQRRPEHA